MPATGRPKRCHAARLERQPGGGNRGCRGQGGRRCKHASAAALAPERGARTSPCITCTRAGPPPNDMRRPFTCGRCGQAGTARKLLASLCSTDALFVAGCNGGQQVGAAGVAGAWPKGAVAPSLGARKGGAAWGGARGRGAGQRAWPPSGREAPGGGRGPGLGAPPAGAPCVMRLEALPRARCGRSASRSRSSATPSSLQRWPPGATSALCARARICWACGTHSGRAADPP